MGGHDTVMVPHQQPEVYRWNISGRAAACGVQHLHEQFLPNWARTNVRSEEISNQAKSIIKHIKIEDKD